MVTGLHIQHGMLFRDSPHGAEPQPLSRSPSVLGFTPQQLRLYIHHGLPWPSQSAKPQPSFNPAALMLPKPVTHEGPLHIAKTGCQLEMKLWLPLDHSLLW